MLTQSIFLAGLFLTSFASYTSAQHHDVVINPSERETKDYKTSRSTAITSHSNAIARKPISQQVPQLESSSKSQLPNVADTTPSAKPAFGKDLRKPDTETSSDGAIDALLIIDSSGSMKKTDPKRMRDQAARMFIRFLDERDRLGILQFDAEVKEIRPLSPVSEQAVLEMDKSISKISDDGGFTDLHAPTQAALDIFQKQGRKNVRKCVILLSDGKMDPHPSKGTGASLIERLFRVELPEFEREGITLYTLSLTDKADRALLEQLAHATGGLHWYAPTAESLHLRYSDLFLSLKTPQIIPLGKNSFEIDSGAKEATLYITRNDDESLRVIIQDPIGRRISSQNLVPDAKWYKAKMFDVITFKNPTPGVWLVLGIDNPQGYATLLTDLKLQVDWPYELLSYGDSMLVTTRLMQGDKPLDNAEMKQVLFYTYKIINTATNDVVDVGPLNDQGEKGDEKQDDGLYSRELTFSQPGDYKALISVTAPTFTRQRSISFSVSKEMISASFKSSQDRADDIMSGQFIVTLAPLAERLHNKSVQLRIRRQDKTNVSSIELQERTNDAGRPFVFSPQTSPSIFSAPGTYNAYAWVGGEDASDKKKEYRSSDIIFVIPEPPVLENQHQKPQPAEVTEEHAHQDEEVKQESPNNETESDTTTGVIGITCALIWVVALNLIFTPRFKSEGGATAINSKPFELSSDIAYALSDLRARSSESKRTLTQQELDLFNMSRAPLSDDSESVEITAIKSTDSKSTGNSTTTNDDDSNNSMDELA